MTPARRRPGTALRAVKTLRFDCAIGRWSLHLLAPPEDLAPYVDTFWEVHGFANYERERILPKGNIELMFNLGLPHRVLDPGHPSGAATYRDAWLSGLQRRPLVIEPCFDVRRVPSHLVAARLRPAGAYALLGMAMDEVSNQVIDLDALLGRSAASASEQLREQPTTEARLALLEQFVRARVAVGPSLRPLVNWAVAEIERAHGALRIDTLNRELGVSRKHLSRTFREEIGLAPKQYAGIMRFQRLLTALRQPAPQSWSALAQSCGYYDQAHLNHDCQSFAGMAPTRMLQTLSPDGVAAVELPE